jgi:hypothetical protein
MVAADRHLVLPNGKSDERLTDLPKSPEIPEIA